MLALAQSRVVIALLGLLTSAEESIVGRGLALAAAIGALGLLAALSDAYYWRSTWFYGRRWGVAVLALLFSKATRLRIDVLSGVSTGHVISLASSDVERFLQAVHHLPHLVLAPIDFIIYAAFLYADLGVACFAGLGLMLLLSLAQLLFYSRAYGQLRRQRSGTTDERLNLTAQVLAGIRVIKANSWEPPFLRAVRAVRSREVAQLQAQYMVRGTFEGLIHSKYLALAGATVLTLWAMGEAITPQKVYSATALFYLLEMDRAWRFVENAENLADLRVSLERFTRFFTLPEVVSTAATASNSDAPRPSIDCDAILCAATPQGRDDNDSSRRIDEHNQIADPAPHCVTCHGADTSLASAAAVCGNSAPPAADVPPASAIRSLSSSPSGNVSDAAATLPSPLWALELEHVVAVVVAVGRPLVHAPSHLAEKTGIKSESAAAVAGERGDERLSSSTDEADDSRLIDSVTLGAAKQGGLCSKDAGSASRGVAVLLDDVTLRVAPGELCAIVGETGSGKTSLLLARCPRGTACAGPSCTPRL